MSDDFDDMRDPVCLYCHGSGELMTVEGWDEECPHCINGFDEYGTQRSAQASPELQQVLADALEKASGSGHEREGGE